MIQTKFEKSLVKRLGLVDDLSAFEQTADELLEAATSAHQLAALVRLGTRAELMLRDAQRRCSEHQPADLVDPGSTTTCKRCLAEIENTGDGYGAVR